MSWHRNRLDLRVTHRSSLAYRVFSDNGRKTLPESGQHRSHLTGQFPQTPLSWKLHGALAWEFGAPQMAWTCRRSGDHSSVGGVCLSHIHFVRRTHTVNVCPPQWHSW